MHTLVAFLETDLQLSITLFKFQNYQLKIPEAQV